MKKLIALILSVFMLFTCVMPVCAAETGSELSSEVSQVQPVSIIEKITDFFHRLIEKLFFLFGLDCSWCSGKEEETVIPENVKEIVSCYNSGINSLKNYKGIVAVKKTEDVASVIGDCPAVAASIINEVAESFTGITENTYTFSGGVTAQGESITDKVDPYGREACLSQDGVACATSEALEGGKSRISLVLAEEKAVFDGTSNISETEHNFSVGKTVNFAQIDFGGPIDVNSADITYTATTLDAELDAKGRITSLKIYTPVSMLVAMDVAVISMTVTAKAQITTEYTFTYWS